MIQARFVYFENDPLPTAKYDIEDNMKKYALMKPGDTISLIEQISGMMLPNPQ